MSSKRESSMNSEENSETCGQRLFKKDDRYFRKYIDNTTAHGVVRIFTGKSIIRRLFWLVIVLGATAGCLNNVIDRIIYLAGQPTSTTVSITRQPSLTFPAVTVCNLNQFRRDYVNSIHPNLSRLLRDVYYTDSDDPTDILDNTRRNCQGKSETSSFNFLRNEYNYSTSSCLVDCLLTSICDNCGCNLASDIFPPDNEVYQKRPDCNIADICRQVDEYRTSQDCDCPSACISNTYDIFTSYSAFPAQYAINDLEDIFSDVFNTSFDSEANLLSVNVYFETLNIETQTTNDAYGAVALLSDIGGQLGLFMGVSVISIMEFATWIIDEVKNRVFGKGVSETKICSCCKRMKVKEREAELDGVADDKFTQSQN